MSDRYFDRDGTPLNMLTWAAKNTGEYKRVAEDTVDDWWVSTVWLGVNYRFGEGPPLIFETMVFAQAGGEVTSWGEEFGWRYETEADAQAGHDRVVGRLREGADPRDVQHEFAEDAA